jgi:hypothetical protein
MPVQPPSQKHSGSLQTQITSTSSAIPFLLEGRIAIVTDVGRGMRWTRLRQETNDVVRGRRSRVVLTPRRWRQVGERNFIDDGGNKARSPGRARNRPLKPLRRDGRGISGEPVVTMLVCLFHFAREAAGATGARLSLLPSWGSTAPSVMEGRACCTTRADRAAGTRKRVNVIACDKREAFVEGSECDEAIHPSFAWQDGLLRGACHRARIRATRWLAKMVWTAPDGISVPDW